VFRTGKAVIKFGQGRRKESRREKTPSQRIELEDMQKTERLLKRAENWV